MQINKTTTLMRKFWAPAEDGSDLGGSAQDVESRIQNALFGADDSETEVDDDVVDQDGDENLPDDDDTDADADDELDDDSDSEVADTDDEDDVTLASALGLDEDKLEYDDEGNVVFNATIDGENKKVSISELVKSYQLEGHVNNKSIKLDDDRKQFEETRDKAYGALTERLTIANGLIGEVEKSIIAEFDQIDWDSLRVTDPAEWSAARQQFSERAQQIANAKQALLKVANETMEQQKSEQKVKYEEFMQAEYSKMVADNPTWADQSVMASDIKEIGSFLRDNYGFTNEEIANNMDSRLMRLIQDARKVKLGDKVASKKVQKQIPKFTKPGTNSGDRPSLKKARQIKATKQAIRKSGGSIDAIAAAIEDRM